MSFASEDLNKIKRVLFGPESVIKISPSGAHSMEVPDAHFDNVPWTVRAHTNDDGQLTVFVEKGEEMLTENYSRGDDGPGWVTNYIPVVFDGHNK